MARVVDGWIWEPADAAVLRQAVLGTDFPNTASYRMAAESLCSEGFIILTSFGGSVLRTRLTTKGRGTAKRVLG